jgi:hypothetical protein
MLAWRDLMGDVAGGEVGDTIHGTFSLASLDDPPKYEALSYAWGDPKEIAPMSREGHQVPITTNLRCALNNLRHECEDRIFWVDALCIDQSNPAERGRQVSQMRYVYELASTVVVFAGGMIEGYDVAMDYIETIGGDSKLHYDPQIEPHADAMA